MAEEVQNNTANVTSLKGVKGGYLFSAPLGTTLPTTPSPTLDAAFVNLGYIPQDGAPVFSNEIESETYKDVNGDSILVLKQSEQDSFTVTLCEVKDTVMKEIYGQANVTTSGSTNKTMTVLHKGVDTAGRVYVFLFLTKDGRKWCRVIPDGVISAMGDEAPFDGVYGREVTIECLTDAALGSIADYIEMPA